MFLAKCQVATCPSIAFTTPGGGFTLFFLMLKSCKDIVISNFANVCLARPGIEPQSTVSAANNQFIHYLIHMRRVLCYDIHHFKSNLSFARCITLEHVTSGGDHLQVIALAEHSFFRRNVAAVASCWQHSVRFDGFEISTSDLPLQWRKRCRLTNCPVSLLKYSPVTNLLF